MNFLELGRSAHGPGDDGLWGRAGDGSSNPTPRSVKSRLLVAGLRCMLL